MNLLCWWNNRCCILSLKSSSRIAQAPCRCGTLLSCQHLSNLPRKAVCYGDGQIYKSHGYGYDGTHLMAHQPKKQELLSPLYIFMHVYCSCSHGKPFPMTFPVILPMVCFSGSLLLGQEGAWQRLGRLQLPGQPCHLAPFLSRERQ